MARKDQKITLSPLEEQLFNLPNIGDVLKSGKEIKVNQLPLDLQRQLGLSADQSFSFDPTFLQNLNAQENNNPQYTNKKGQKIDRVTGQPTIDQNLASKVSPFNNIVEALKSGFGQIPASDMALAKKMSQPSSLTQTPMEQSQLVSGGLPELLQKLKNIVGPKLQNNPIVQASGIPFINSIQQGKPTSIGTGGAIGQGTSVGNPQDLTMLQRTLNELIHNSPAPYLANSDINARNNSDINKKLNNIVPSQTLEQSALKQLAIKNPELAAQTPAQTDETGLKKYAGSGEFRINGQRFKVDNNANIVKIG